VLAPDGGNTVGTGVTPDPRDANAPPSPQDHLIGTPVRRASLKIGKTTATEENIAAARRPEQIRQTEKQLEEARVNTRAQDAARERLARVQQRNRRDPRRKTAESELEAALREWERLTGRVPPR
jgi:hypothetical protein